MDIYVANKGAVVWWNGSRHSILRGKTTVRAGHPLLAQNPELFSPLRVDFDVPPQTADGAPSEPRPAAAKPAPKPAPPAPKRPA